MKKILVVGATGNLGPHLVKAFVDGGHQVSALIRPATIQNAQKIDPLKQQGVRLIEGDLEDQDSLDRACEGQDVVVSAVGGDQIMNQVNLAKAASKAGVERFIPSEFGVDPHTVGSGSIDLIDAKLAAQEHIKSARVPYTMIYNNGFMEFWGTGLGQLGPTFPPEQVQLFGDGSCKMTMTSLPDIGRITCAIIDDPGTINQEVLIANNEVSQDELIKKWESVSGQSVSRIPVSAQDLEDVITSSTAPDQMMQRVFAQLHRSVWVKGDGKEKRAGVLDASQRYPDIPVTTLDEYFSNFV